MAEFIDPQRLQALSALGAQPWPPEDCVNPVMRWFIDQSTGRAVARWELAPKQVASSLQV